MDEETATIKKNDTCNLVEFPDGKNIVGLKWVYKTKQKEDEKIQKHKAQLVPKGNLQ